MSDEETNDNVAVPKPLATIVISVVIASVLGGAGGGIAQNKLAPSEAALYEHRISKLEADGEKIDARLDVIYNNQIKICTALGTALDTKVDCK